jgi:hypothetical protein
MRCLRRDLISDIRYISDFTLLRWDVKEYFHLVVNAEAKHGKGHSHRTDGRQGPLNSEDSTSDISRLYRRRISD